jgi:predicted CXXCH cytochrome family protein
MKQKDFTNPFFTLVTFAVLFAPVASFGKMSVVYTPHNLSASGGLGKHQIAFSEEQRVCIFCHAPHNSNPTSGIPLWNRQLPDPTKYNYPYQSSTLQASPKPGLPTGASRLCLSCHDGTIALGAFGGSTITSAEAMPSDVDPTRNPNLTTNLSNHHPISFSYTAGLAAAANLVPPASLPQAIKLESGGLLQCTACHDPHDNEFGNFLVINNTDPSKPGYSPGSPLCVACHSNVGWNSSAHNPSSTPALVNGCMNCHTVHSAPNPARLLQYVKEEDNCFLNCHNSNLNPSSNVQPLFAAEMYRHPVEIRVGIHDENEDLPAKQYHVECADCHNPHQVNNSGAPLSTPPTIDGRLKGVKGISKDTLGTVIASNEYEICFKCHSGGFAGNFSGITEPKPNRLIPDLDQMKRFNGTNPSFHPVTADRRTNGASLLSQYQSSMIRVYCSDCHNSDQSQKAKGSGPNGPHGSRYVHILMAQYNMPPVGTPPPAYVPALYDLCFQCHSEPYIMGTTSGFINQGANEHATHVKTRGIPCFVCHDPHGVPAQDGATQTNHAHLVNFDLSYTASSAVPVPVYVSSGPAKGSCTVSCHTNGTTHSYAP